MSDLKISPTPWEVFDHSVVSELVFLGDGRVGANWIAEISVDDRDDLDGDDISISAVADLLLMAAAPDLYEVLDDLVFHLTEIGWLDEAQGGEESHCPCQAEMTECSRCENGRILLSIVEQARAALVKAGGKE